MRGCALWGAGAQSPGWVRQRTIPRGASLHRAPLPFATAIAHVHDAHQTFCADHVAQKKASLKVPAFSSDGGLLSVGLALTWQAKEWARTERTRLSLA